MLDDLDPVMPVALIGTGMEEWCFCHLQ